MGNPPPTPAKFQQARIKLQWSNVRINELHAHWQSFLETDFCKLVVEDHADGAQSLKVVSVEPLPHEMPLILGDAIHNMRCALDYALAEILGFKDTRLTFPMGETREELVATFRTGSEVIGNRTVKAGRNASVERTIPGIGAFFADSIRPYKGSGSLLWELNKLDGRDKHRLLLPVLIPQTISGINAVDRNNNRLQNCSGTVGAGGVVNMVLLGAGGLKIESYGKPTAEILIDEPGIIQCAPVLPILVQMGQAVAKTLDEMSAFLDAQSAHGP